jgi:hypothetical protein
MKEEEMERDGERGGGREERERWRGRRENGIWKRR